MRWTRPFIEGQWGPSVAEIDPITGRLLVRVHGYWTDCGNTRQIPPSYCEVSMFQGNRVLPFKCRGEVLRPPLSNEIQSGGQRGPYRLILPSFAPNRVRWPWELYRNLTGSGDDNLDAERCALDVLWRLSVGKTERDELGQKLHYCLLRVK